MRIELTHQGFADLSLATWVPRHKVSSVRFVYRLVKLQSVCGVTETLARKAKATYNCNSWEKSDLTPQTLSKPSPDCS